MRGSAEFPSTSLAVWMNGVRVGVWSRQRGASDAFAYDEAWTSSPAARVLSLSLPFTADNAPIISPAVRWFFDNLLPDPEAIRQRVRARFGTRSTEAFDLLAAIGRDCVGAVQLLPLDESPADLETLQAEPLTTAGVAAAITAALASGGPTLGADTQFRISLAGAQEKTALLWHNNAWHRPLGTTPTTHIFKLPLGLVGSMGIDLHDSVENEWLCGQLLTALGLPVAHSEMARFGSHRVLVVERFDRLHQASGWIARRPQEDFCQALAVPGQQKYEADGGPGIADIMRILATGAAPVADRQMFLRALIVFWLLAATDGHAKNFSLFHERGGTHRLAPFYDVLSAWPYIGRGVGKLEIQKVKLAMAVRSKNVHWKLREIRPDHWHTVARKSGLGDADAILHDIVTRGASALAKVSRRLPRNFPAAVSDAIFDGLTQGLRTLSAGSA